MIVHRSEPFTTVFSHQYVKFKLQFLVFTWLETWDERINWPWAVQLGKKSRTEYTVNRPVYSSMHRTLFASKTYLPPTVTCKRKWFFVELLLIPISISIFASKQRVINIYSLFPPVGSGTGGCKYFWTEDVKIAWDREPWNWFWSNNVAQSLFLWKI